MKALSVTSRILLFTLLLTIFSQAAIVARPSVNGALHVDGTALKDSAGNEVVVRGVSTHGLTWYPKYIDDEVFRQVSVDWNANLIRLAMYSEDYCHKHKKENLELLKKGIEFAIKHDMYVLVDWHILNDNNPMQNLAQALEFFNMIAKEYANVPNIIWEICNEPNGNDVTWEHIKEYSSIVIPVIRKYSPQAVIIIGTPNYDLNIEEPARDPLHFENIMYTFHFYASTHHENYRKKLVEVIEGGTPIFMTECGLSESSGDGRTDFDEVRKWYSLMVERQLSYVVWSLSNKDETSAFIRGDILTGTELKDEVLTPVGLYVKALLRGGDPNTIPVAKLKGVRRIEPRSAMAWGIFAGVAAALIILFSIVRFIWKKSAGKKAHTYNDLLSYRTDKKLDESDVAKFTAKKAGRRIVFGKFALLLCTFCTLVYLTWRALFSIPFAYGNVAVVCSILLLIVEVVGFVESVIHYFNMLGFEPHPLPKIDESEFPDVDIFISTYNEPTELLRKTINGCKHMQYPDKSKVHIYLCDDHRRSEMRELAESMGVNYFDRPDNKGAKAGNLNAAMARTSSPYIVTFDADMIPRREFLLKTIPYFVEAEKINAALPEEKRIPLGIIQTPQSFYNPDVFQHNLYAETRVPNEQDFFYRCIEAAKTSSNSVIYGGSNTILSRKALEAIGGFYTESITEDFATGLLIESHGFVSLGLSEPLASGLAPTSFKEHVQQRTRWARGVIATAKQLKIARNKKLNLRQKFSYLSSAMYWYSPILQLTYILAPLLFAVCCIPIFNCTVTDLLMFWLPMHLSQAICLRAISGNTLSTRWSGIYEVSVMPFLLLPVIKETFGITLSTFKVTQKGETHGKRTMDKRKMFPFVILGILSLVGIVHTSYIIATYQYVGMVAVLFWLFRNLYFIAMSLFMGAGRDHDGENVKVIAAEGAKITNGNGKEFEGITTRLTEHCVNVYLDEPDALRLGEPVSLSVDTGIYKVSLKGSVVYVKKLYSEEENGVYTVEILDFMGYEAEYLQILYDRIPTLPQNLARGEGLKDSLWNNIAHRIAGK